MSGRPALLVVAPHGSARDELADDLTAAGHKVRTAGDAVAGLRDKPAGAVVLESGPEAVRRVRAAHPALAVVAIAARDSVDDRCALLAAGADDCVHRPFAVRELVVRLEAVMRRTAPPAGALAYADVRLDLDAAAAWRGDRPLALTDTERRLLARLLERPEKVVARRDLLLGVWGYDPGPASNCLGVYVGYLRRKLELGGEPRLVHTVRGAGYVLRTEELRKSPRSSLTHGVPAPSLRPVALSPYDEE